MVGHYFYSDDIDEMMDHPNRFGARWGLEEDDDLAKALTVGTRWSTQHSHYGTWKATDTLESIAREHQRTESAIVSRTVHLVNSGIIHVEINPEYNVMRMDQFVSSLRREQPKIQYRVGWQYERFGARWTEEEFRALIWMIHDGEELADIAMHLGRTERAIMFQILHQLREEKIIFTMNQDDSPQINEEGE